MKRFWDDYIHYNIPFFVLGSIAVLLLIISWLAPPPWQIHASVIQGVAEIFAIMALWTIHSAVVKGKTAKLKKGDVEIEIIEKKEEETK